MEKGLFKESNEKSVFLILVIFITALARNASAATVYATCFNQRQK